MKGGMHPVYFPADGEIQLRIKSFSPNPRQDVPCSMVFAKSRIAWKSSRPRA